MQAVILVNGEGKFLAPYKTLLPKTLIPIMEIFLLHLKKYCFHKVELAVGHLAGIIEAYCGDGSGGGMKITSSSEDEPQVTAGMKIARKCLKSLRIEG